MLNLDTHVLVHALGGDLRRREKEVLERNEWSISAIVLWELAKLVQLGRMSIDLNDREVVRTLQRNSSLADRSGGLANLNRQLDFTGDRGGRTHCGDQCCA